MRYGHFFMGTAFFPSIEKIGNFMILMNACSWALYLVLVKSLMGKYDSLTIMKWIFFFGFIMITPFSFSITASSSFAKLPFYI